MRANTCNGSPPRSPATSSSWRTQREKDRRDSRRPEAGLHVLADKPGFCAGGSAETRRARPADERDLIAYDIMTERYEATSTLQRAFVQDADILGTMLPGSPLKSLAC